MAENNQPATPQPNGRRIETTAQTLSRLLAEGNWTHRALRDATEKAGRRLAHASIGNIARGERAAPDTLAFLARVMDRDPDEFAEVRLARARRLFDPDQVGLETAVANYEVIYPTIAAVDELVNAHDQDKDRAAAIHAEFETLRARALAQDPESTADETTPPPNGEAPQERRIRDRRRRPEAS